MSCELTLRNYPRKLDIDVYRVNGYGPIGVFKWDATWRTYRFHPDSDFSLSKGDLEDLLYLIKRLK